ncbi:MAG: hypothetical protein M1835_004422 [Candelina submexicana]|nr:MAG: hypothetical protein M1835_004422 [Candelina submexicana]
MAYTSATMHAILPGLGSMPDIGSVAANFARNREEDDTRDFLRVDKRASFVRYNFGEALFDDYQAVMELEQSREVIAFYCGGAALAAARVHDPHETPKTFLETRKRDTKITSRSG